MTYKAKLFAGGSAAFLVVALAVSAFSAARAPKTFVTSGPVAESIAGRGVVVAQGGVAKIRPRIDGRVLRVLVAEGEVVKAGQVLAEVDPSLHQAELARLDAEAQALEAVASAGVDGAPPEARGLELGVDAAQHEANLLKERADRALALEASGAYSHATAEDAVNASRDAFARLSSAISRARLGKGNRKADMLATTVRAAAARAVADELRRKLHNAGFVAPISGTVVARRLDPGDSFTVDTGEVPAAFEIADTTNAELRVEIEEADSERIKVGAAATAFRMGSAEVFSGNVVRVGARLERRSREVEAGEVRGDGLVRVAWVRWDGSNTRPFPLGQRFDLILRVGERNVAARVPRQSVTVVDGHAQITVMHGPFRSERTVELGLADEKFVEVLGIEEGTRIANAVPH